VSGNRWRLYSDERLLITHCHSGAIKLSVPVRVVDRKNDDGFAAEFFGEIQGKLERAKAPLKELIDKIEKENPDQFS